jgi:predicted nuclease with TOPRIM domain
MSEEKTTQTNIGESLSKLKAYYEDDEDSLSRIEQDQNRLEELQDLKDFNQNNYTKRLLKECRQDITRARYTLATDSTLREDNPEAKKKRDSQWFLITSRAWFLERVSVDYEAELRMLEADLISQLEHING